ncbi:hypothetical protein V492_06685 [Pseudogymnoascus sp. VKM F-4246]|nr:hypothetical protein V492_06685 [Pseudogymnoascus sp. VKM F-4246]
MTADDYTAMNGTQPGMAKMETTKEIKVQFSTAAQLNKIDKLRELGVAKFVALPQLVVVGDQSSGKSSVLEAVMELPLPRDSGLCTRFATNITFRRSPQTNIAVSIIPGPTRSPEKAEELNEYKKTGLTTLDGQTFLGILKEVCQVMGVTGPGEKLSAGKSTFCADVFKIELSGPDRENLSIIDIPGIFRTATDGVTTNDDIELVKSMVSGWIQDDRTIILAVVPANVDIATQEILTMAEKADPKGLRTLGVLTKPDLVDKGAEDQVIDLVMGRRNKLKLGYCIVRNRAQQELNTDSDSRTRTESNLFKTAPWCLLPKHRVGIDALKFRLRDLLSEIIQREFPKIKRQIEEELHSCKKQLSQLGADRETPEQQRHYLEGIAAQFESISKDALSANYCRHEIFDEDHKLRLPTLVVDRSDRFAEDIKRRGHTVPFKATEDLEADPFEDFRHSEIDLSPPSPPDMDNRDEVDFDSKSSEYPELLDVLRLDLNVSPTTKRNILSWIEDEYRKARGYSLDLMDPNILPMLWQKQSSNWQGIALSFMNDIVAFVHDFICRLLRHVCPDSKVRGGLLAFIMDDLLKKYRVAIKHVEFILRVERHGTLLTKNHYFGDTLTKMRNDRLIKAMKKHEFRATRTGVSGNPGIDVVSVASLNGAIFKGNLEHAVEDINAVLQAYYKVVMKRFIDTVVAQGVDYYLLTSDESPIKILTPIFVSSMTPGQLDEIAGEDLITKRERQELKEKVRAFEQGRELLRSKQPTANKQHKLLPPSDNLADKMPPRKSKKTADTINSRLALVIKSGKVTLGFKSTLKSLRSGKAKLVIIAGNCPPLRKSELEYYAMLSKCPVHHFSGNNIDLGTACGKLFRCSTMVVLDAGDSDILTQET